MTNQPTAHLKLSWKVSCAWGGGHFGFRSGESVPERLVEKCAVEQERRRTQDWNAVQRYLADSLAVRAGIYQLRISMVQSMSVSVGRSVFPFVYVCFCLSLFLSIYIFLSFCLPVSLPAVLPTQLPLAGKDPELVLGKWLGSNKETQLGKFLITRAKTGKTSDCQF